MQPETETGTEAIGQLASPLLSPMGGARRLAE
jgi:hypothetical protein